MKLNTSISNRFTRNNYPIQIENTNWNFLIGHLEYSDNVLYKCNPWNFEPNNGENFVIWLNICIPDKYIENTRH